ncbi:MAG: glutamate--tRNA ligase family protein [archaeon]
MIKKEIIKAYVLKNALEHNGKANQGSIINSLFNHGLKKQDIPKIIPEIQQIINQVNKLNKEQQEKEFEKLENIITYRKERQGLPELPNLKKGKVITRFSPSPSGPLHIGHLLAILPNFLYAEKYKGKFYIRIEDTNPENIYKPAYNMIKKEANWLCKNKVKFIIQSERLDIYYKYAEKLINKKAAYVCTCSQEQFKEFVSKKQNCPCRNLLSDKQLERWGKMLSKTKNSFQPGEAVLRFKSGMQQKNPAMRDFPLARINTTSHPLQKNKYKVWPLMNLSVTVDDIELKITHIIRGKDHKDNAKRQEMMYKVLGKQKSYPYTAFIGRLHFKDLKLSATQMRKDVESGKYKSWDDPKLPTIASLKKQGYKPEAFYEYATQRGISETDKTITSKDFYEVINNFNKKIK